MNLEPPHQVKEANKITTKKPEIPWLIHDLTVVKPGRRKLVSNQGQESAVLRKQVGILERWLEMCENLFRVMNML